MASAQDFEQHRAALTGHCYRMMGSARGDRTAAMNSFLDTEMLFLRFGSRSSGQPLDLYLFPRGTDEFRPRGPSIGQNPAGGT
jgi:hypothetical protein